ncbi:MAG: radical SAM protein [Nanoarchaeota archaeon]
MITENKNFSYTLGELPRGCQFCVRGEKLVCFVTGICPRRCNFCPVSDEKYGKDVSFANERKVVGEHDLLLEADMMKARGAGMTGGDPLSRMEKTVLYIKMLKQKHGASFHIHLYTSLNLVTTEKLEQLYAAGLDEIRFHLDLDSPLLWPRLELARKFSWDMGVELPLLPTKEEEIKKVIDFIHNKVTFLVLNELEIADNTQSQLTAMGFKTKDELSYAVQGSVETGLRLLRYVEEKRYRLPVHLCTAKLKDRVQLGNRLKREAKSMKKPFDRIDEDGLLVRGALYLPDLVPGFGYREKLRQCDKVPYIERLKIIAEKLKQEFRLQDDELYVDTEKPRILLSEKKIKPLSKKLKSYGLIPSLVKEYPTADQLEIEVEFT